MMEAEFHENSVLTGITGSFCLLCEKYIKKTEPPVHIATSEHKEKLQLSAYVDKYKDDHVRKVNAGYYCEPCNTLLQTSSKVAMHVASTTHAANLIYHLVREVDTGLVVFDDILIKKQAWSGQNQESCFVCNMDFSDENHHANEPSHILNVIQGKLELKRDKFVYRKVDDGLINCLTCNSLITIDSKESHTNDLEHVSNYTKCQENFKIYENQNELTESTKKAIKPTETKSNLVENGNEINIEEAEENSKKINDISTEDCNVIVSPTEALRNVMKFAKENNLKYKRNNTYCKVCDVKIASSLKRLQEHVAEQSHKDKVGGYVKVVVEKVPYTQFRVAEFTVTFNMFLEDVVINEKFCLSNISFHTFSEHGVRVRCQACEVSMDRGEIQKHVMQWQHIQVLQEAAVLTTFDTELVRELRPKVYHCGFCNFIESSMTGLKNHLKSLDHQSMKAGAMHRLISHMEAYREKTHEKLFASLLLGRVLS